MNITRMYTELGREERFSLFVADTMHLLFRDSKTRNAGIARISVRLRFWTVCGGQRIRTVWNRNNLYSTMEEN